MSAIDEKTNHLSTKIATDKSKNALKLRDEMITEELKMLHNEFFIVPNDKASSIIAFVCPVRYAQVQINKIGLNDVNSITSTYKKATKKPVDEILGESTQFLKSKCILKSLR